MAIARDSGVIVGQAVTLDRSLPTLQAFADTLPAAPRSTSAGHALDQEIVWPQASTPIVSQAKQET